MCSAPQMVMLTHEFPVLTYAQLADFLKKRDPASYYALVALQKMKGEKLAPYVDDILRILNHNGHTDAWSQYLARSEELRKLQATFEKTGRYPAGSYQEVRPIDDQRYKLALLISFISTVHRFEILESLVEFLRLPCDAPKRLLSIGYGTGYELKIAYDHLPDWEIQAFDNSPTSFEYASALLNHFNYPATGLRQSLFPLETKEGLENYQNKYGRILVCELLEHLERPQEALANLKSALHEDGLMYLTMAINISQEDHVFLYTNQSQAREQVLQCGFTIVKELVSPVTVVPFTDRQREGVFRKGNYIAVVRRSSSRGS